MMNGILFLCLFNISDFSSINSLEAMSKRTQEDAGEERVTAKSKPMINLVSRCSVRNPNVLASTASESQESNIPIKSRSFLNRVNDRLRKMLDRSPDNSMQDIDKRSMIW